MSQVFRPYLTGKDKSKLELIRAKMTIAGFNDDLGDITSMAITCLAEVITPVLLEVNRTDLGIPEIIKHHVINGIVPDDQEIPY